MDYLRLRACTRAFAHRGAVVPAACRRNLGGVSRWTTPGFGRAPARCTPRGAGPAGVPSKPEGVSLGTTSGFGRAPGIHARHFARVLDRRVYQEPCGLELGPNGRGVSRSVGWGLARALPGWGGAWGNLLDGRLLESPSHSRHAAACQQDGIHAAASFAPRVACHAFCRTTARLASRRCDKGASRRMPGRRCTQGAGGHGGRGAGEIEKCSESPPARGPGEEGGHSRIPA